MKRIALLAAITALVGSTAAIAATPPPYCYAAAPCAFVTVDSIRITANQLYVTGILEGEATATERVVYFSTSTAATDYMANCERLAMLALAKPGQFVLRLAMPADAYTFTTCQLTRVTP